MFIKCECTSVITYLYIAVEYFLKLYIYKWLDKLVVSVYAYYGLYYTKVRFWNQNEST